MAHAILNLESTARGAPMLLLALLACNPEDTGDTDATEDLPTPYVVDEEEPPEAAYTAEELGAAVQEAVDEVLAINAEPIMDGYAAAMAGESDGCPDYYSNEAGEYWFDQCTSSTGHEFSGYGFYYGYDGFYDGGSNMTYWGGQLYGAAIVHTPEGYEFTAAGGAQSLYAQHATDPVEVWQTYIQGTFGYDGPEADGTWMKGALSPDFAWYAYKQTEANGHYAYVDGGIAGFSGDITAVSFDQVAIGDASIGWPCAGEPHGMMSVRTADGFWYDVLFDGPDPDTWVVDDPDACDGCGEGYFRGEALGQVCVDFSPLTDWGSPW